MQTIPLAQRMLNWQKEGHEIAVELIQTVGGAVPRTIPTNGNGHTRRNGNGGTTTTAVIPEIVKAFVASTPGGVAVSDIHAHLEQSGTTVSKEALQRALGRMREAKLLRVRGKNRAMRYLPPPEAL